jgi:hypothetical protein
MVKSEGYLKRREKKDKINEDIEGRVVLTENEQFLSVYSVCCHSKFGSDCKIHFLFYQIIVE